MFSAMFKKAKSQDFPVECRAMYYFAKGRHAHQERKGSGMPYFVHPRGVAWLVKKYGGSITQINAAFGHDLLEDTDFGLMLNNFSKDLKNDRYKYNN